MTTRDGPAWASHTGKQTPSEEEIVAGLIDIISDGFNRSLGALRDVGAIDTVEMDSAYKGLGSRYPDLVTEQIVKTPKISITARMPRGGVRAVLGSPTIRELFASPEGGFGKVRNDTEHPDR